MLKRRYEAIEEAQAQRDCTNRLSVVKWIVESKYER